MNWCGKTQTSCALKQKQKKGELEITDLSEQFEEIEEEVIHHLLTKDELKEKEKSEKKAAKEKSKSEKKAAKEKSKSKEKVASKSRVFVLDFKGHLAPANNAGPAACATSQSQSQSQGPQPS